MQPPSAPQPKQEDKSPQVDLNPTPSPTKTILTQTATLLGNTELASPTGGEMVFEHQPAFSTVLSVLTPGKVLGGGIQSFFKNCKEVFLDKKRLIPVLVLAVVWLVLTVLPLFGIYSQSLWILSILTFAHGGLNAGLPGFIGGVIGKGVFAGAITAILIPLLSGKNPFAGMGGGFRRFVSSFQFKNVGNIAPLVCGVGIALILYNFLAGFAFLQNSLAGVAALFLSLRALSGTGFLRKALSSAFYKSKHESSQITSSVNRIITGFASGFALSVLFSTLNIWYLCYVVGLVFVLAAIVLLIVSAATTKKASV